MLLQGRAFDVSGSATAQSGADEMTKGVGTQLWMAPEVFFGIRRYGREVDVVRVAIVANIQHSLRFHSQI